MGSTSFTRRAVLQSDGTYELKYRTSTGELRTQILEDKSAGGISSAAVEQSDGSFEISYKTSAGDTRTQIIEDKSVGGVSTRTLELKKENISSTIEIGKIAYTVTDNFNANSLCVYLNGVNVSPNITVTGSNTFTFSSDYTNGIVATDELLVVYVKA